MTPKRRLFYLKISTKKKAEYRFNFQAIERQIVRIQMSILYLLITTLQDLVMKLLVERVRRKVHHYAREKKVIA